MQPNGKRRSDISEERLLPVGMIRPGLQKTTKAMIQELRHYRSRIHTDNVGGRVGCFQYPVVKVFNDDTVHHKFEADGDCAEQIRSIMATKHTLALGASHREVSGQ